MALADVLGTSPPKLTRLPVPAPGNGGTDSAVEAVRQALLAVGHQRPVGQTVPVQVLRARVTAAMEAHYHCDWSRKIGATLPELKDPVDPKLRGWRTALA